jgi:hypothetical protein
MRERILSLSELKADASRLLDQIRDEPTRSSSSISSPQTPLKTRSRCPTAEAITGNIYTRWRRIDVRLQGGLAGA